MGPTPLFSVGRYDVHRVIARGGMAAVHFGRLNGAVGFGRTVAVKRMRPEITDKPYFLKMFIDEARIASRIQHPNVVPILDVLSKDGEVLIVMEYVRGASLSLLLDEQRRAGEPLPVGLAAAVVVQALQGVHAAHSARDERGASLELVHRDISPQNILVGADGLARVLDFGVAKAKVRLETTREGELKGKLAYMAPEQILGDATPQSDLYAMGVVLWEALAGRSLFTSDDPELVMSVLEGKIAPPSTLRADLPPALVDTVMTALSVDTDARFASAREMATALERSCEVASLADVGAWVERTAGASLAKLDAAVSQFESSPSVEAEPVSDPQIAPEAPRVSEAPLASSLPVPPDLVTTVVAPARGSAPPNRSAKSSKLVAALPTRGWRSILAVAALMAATLASGAWLGRKTTIASTAPGSAGPPVPLAALPPNALDAETASAAAPRSSAERSPVASTAEPPSIPLVPPKSAPSPVPRAAPRARGAAPKASVPLLGRY